MLRRPGRLFPRLAPILAALALMAVDPGAASAQVRFGPVIRVNDKAVTQYEIDQRILLLRALGAPGDLARDARKNLIDERLQLQAAEELGIEATDEMMQAGIDEYAQRANTDAANFVAVMKQNGVSEESLNDFVKAGVLWREVARTRFAPRSQVSEDEVDRAMALAGTAGGARVLVSEIIMPARNAEELAVAEARVAEISQLRSFDAFSDAARRYSASRSAGAGGRIDWLSLSDLPPQLRSEVLTLPAGGITDPLRIPNAVAIFQLRALQELPPKRPATVAVDYAIFTLPGAGEAEARALASRVDTCDDFYGEAKGLPEERLLRETRAPDDIPPDIALELAKLDDNEVSTALTRGDARLVLMLCGRTTETAEGLDRGAVRRQLANQRAAAYAEAYLAELKADAVIVDVR